MIKCLLALLVILQFSIRVSAKETHVEYIFAGKKFSSPLTYASLEGSETASFADRSFSVNEYRFGNNKAQFMIVLENNLEISINEYIPVYKRNDIEFTNSHNLTAPKKFFYFNAFIDKKPRKRFGYSQSVQGGFIKVVAIDDDSVDFEFSLTVEKYISRGADNHGGSVNSRDSFKEASVYESLVGTITIPRDGLIINN